MDQGLINLVICGFGTIMGFVLRIIWQALKDLQTTDIELAEKVSKIEVLVAGQYVTRHDFSTSLQRIFTKLDSIDMKLDTKVDK